MLDKTSRDEILNVLEQEREAAQRSHHHYRQKGGAGIDRIDELEKTYYEHATLASMFDCSQWTVEKAIKRIKEMAVGDKDEVSGIFPEWQALDSHMREQFPKEYEDMSKAGLPASRVAIELLDQFRKALDYAKNASDAPDAPDTEYEVIEVEAGMSAGAAESQLIQDAGDATDAPNAGDTHKRKKGKKGRRG